ncbi:MAG TPA: metal ABC transporter substrate-binding protein [Anaerolineaceae bacterium]|nr:metal ABC transporter substrate-binding protein [Anaerolineaceae bacterium]
MNGTSATQTTGQVLVVESFLADLTRDVAGDRLEVVTLIPEGLDPHAFEPTPRDIAQISDSQVLIVNGGGLEEWLKDYLNNRPASQLVIEASAGLTTRTPQPGEPSSDEHAEGDPHFWLNPVNAKRYVENIRDGLIGYDPAGKQAYTDRAAQTIADLQQLDAWIQEQVDQIPTENRLLVTNHESFGYFADRYGFKIVGTVIPSVSTNASPSAQQMARLVDQVKATGARAVFLEVGANSDLAQQLAQDTGIKVVTGLYTHSLSNAMDGAGNYFDMMKHDVTVIVDALR